MTSHAENQPFPFADRGHELAPEYAELRRTCPVAPVATPTGEPAWLVTRHADACAVLADSRFDVGMVVADGAPRLQEVPMTPSVVMDRFRGWGVRREVMDLLGPRQAKRLRSRVRACVTDLLDAMERRGCPGDLCQDLARPLPFTVISELIGFPYADHAELEEKTRVLVSVGGKTEREMREAWTWLRGYFARLLASADRPPSQDLLTLLSEVRDRSPSVSERELVDAAIMVLIAGHKACVSSIANMALTVMLHPEETERLRERPDLVPAALDELWRYTPLGTAGLPRVTAQEVSVGGTRIGPGQCVLVSTAAGNRDPEAFPDPERLDLNRDATGHLAFGHGPHYCPGTALGRMQVEVALEGLLSRFPGIETAVPPQDLVWHQHLLPRTLTALPVRW
ncbi:cytochrome P450 [Streptomyces sp. NPDC045470]|uniref:cytochrome P450 n=1 Tax=unclassified Streptomyces TaxID=2593676 RepID=UPI003401D3A5